MPAQEVGPLDAAFSVGADRTKAIAGPDRIVTDASLLRKDFSIGGAIRSARLTVTALGAYRGYLNGKPIAPQTLLQPGFTDFHKRVLYQTYDVTSLLAIGQEHARFHAGRRLAWLAADVERQSLFCRTGAAARATGYHVRRRSHETIGTDDTWQTAAAPMLSSEIYGGEAYDARAGDSGME